MNSNRLFVVLLILVGNLYFPVQYSYCQVPINDECSGASGISLKPFEGTCISYYTANSKGATKSPINTSCTSNLNDDDIWYYFTASSKSVVLRVFNAVNNSTGKSISIGFSLYEGNCPEDSKALICSNSVNAGNGLLIITNLNPGINYYLRFWTSAPGASATFDFCVQEAMPPVNDEWQNASPVTLERRGTLCSNTHQAITIGATRSLPDPDCTQFNDDDIWYAFNAVSNGVLFNFSNATVATSGSGGANLGYAVYKAPGLPGTISISCNSNIGIRSGSTLIGGLEPGETYYLRLFSYGTNDYVRFDFCLVDQPVIDNDECENATNLPVTNGFCVNPLSGDLANATTSAGFGSPACTALSSSEDVWFKAVVSASGKIKVQTFAVNNRINDLIMEVYSGNCGGLHLIGCFDDDGNLPVPSKNHPSVELTGRSPGETVYFRILGKGNINNGAFVIGAWDPSVFPEISPGLNCLLAENITIDSLHRNQYRWVPVFDLTGNIIAEVYADGANPGDITGSVFVNASGKVRKHEDNYYLDRNLTLTPGKNVSAKVRVYFTREELAALQLVDPSIISAAQLAVMKTESECSNIFTGNGTSINTDTTGGYGEDYYLQFTTPSFSTFYVSGQRSVLPLKFISFTGVHYSGGVKLTWEVVKDNSIKGFRVKNSLNGIDFKEIGFIESDELVKDEKGHWKYQFQHAIPVAGNQFYRIIIIPWQARELYSDIIIVKTSFNNRPFRIYPNPFQGEFFIKRNAPRSVIKWTLLDSKGRVVKRSGRVSFNESGMKIEAKLPTGMYFLKIQICLTNEEYIQKLFSR